MSEMRVGVRNLKARLSEYLRKVRSGQVIVITDHGKAVGRILPAETSQDDLVNARQAADLVDWKGNMFAEVDPPVVNRSQETVSDLLVEIRE